MDNGVPTKRTALKRAPLGQIHVPRVASPSASSHLPARISLSRRTALASCCAAGLASCSSFLHGCASPTGNGATEQPTSSSTFAFDTYCTFTVYGDDTAPAKLAQACARYDKLFDLYRDDSDIARINAAGGAVVTVAAETAKLIARGRELSEASEGLFDITIGAVSTLWDFENDIRPADSAIAEALEHVGYRAIEVDEEACTVRLADAGAKLDLGGIAKGYIADKLNDLLRDETSAQAAVISLGGNIMFYGEKPDGSPWEAGIRDPNDPGGSTVVGSVRIPGGSLVTSGLYERTFELDGVTYWHILDPRTGMPVQTDVTSATVFCPSSCLADALSTTLFVAGSRAGAEIADAHEDTAAYFILQSGGTAESTRWQELTDFAE